MTLENPVVVFWARLAKDVAFNILIAKHPTRIDRLKYTGEVVELGIQSAKCLRTKVMCLGPMWPAAVAVQDSFKTLEQRLIRNVEPVGPLQVSDNAEKTKQHCYILKLDDPDPTGLLPVART